MEDERSVRIAFGYADGSGVDLLYANSGCGTLTNGSNEVWQSPAEFAQAVQFALR